MKQLALPITTKTNTGRYKSDMKKRPSLYDRLMSEPRKPKTPPRHTITRQP